MMPLLYFSGANKGAKAPFFSIKRITAFIHDKRAKTEE